MRRSYYRILALLFFLIFSSNCQDSKESQNDNNVRIYEENFKSRLKGCGYTALLEIEENFLPAEDRVRQIVDNIISYSGLPNNFKLYRTDFINNAFAAIVEGERIIVYDSKLFNNVDWYSDSFWSSVSILAHEIGHHLSGHTGNGLGSNHKTEMEADKFSGFVLYKMGASLEQSLKAMNLLASEIDSETHPSKFKRLRAIKEGWEEASRQRYTGALPPAPIENNLGDFYIFTKEMLINKEYLENEDSGYWYGEYDFQYGIITEVESNYNFFDVRIITPSKKIQRSFGEILKNDWRVYLDEVNFGGNSDMCRACEANLKYLLQPGRRIKFSMIEGVPGGGTIYNGVWFLTYCEVLESNYFD